MRLTGKLISFPENYQKYILQIVYVYKSKVISTYSFKPKGMVDFNFIYFCNYKSLSSLYNFIISLHGLIEFFANIIEGFSFSL